MQKQDKHYTAAVVDGANLAGMIRAMNGQETNFRGLLKVMKELGERDLPLLDRPVITLHPNFCGHGHKLYEDIKKGGFLAIEATSIGSADDAILVGKINELCSDVRICRVIVVSSDHWLIRAVCEGLRRRIQKEGDVIRAYVLGTRCSNDEGRPKIKESLCQAMERSRVVNFVELADYKKYILRT